MCILYSYTFYFRAKPKVVLILKAWLSSGQNVLENYWEVYLTSSILTLNMSQHWMTFLVGIIGQSLLAFVVSACFCCIYL